jgi:hypothetical protein
MADIKQLVGTEYKLKVRVEPYGNVHFGDMDVQCYFYTNPNKYIQGTVLSSGTDENSRIVMFDTAEMDSGSIRMLMRVHIPDSDFEGIETEADESKGSRRDVIDMATGLSIVKQTLPQGF